MKIAIDINELTLKNNTGVKVYTREILNALGRIDKENKYFLYANCKHESMSRFYWINYKNFKFKTIESSFPFWTYTKFSKEIKKDKPDILFMPIQAVPFFKKPKNIKIVVTVHDLAFLLFPNQFTEKDKLLLTFHTKRAINMADSIIVPSEATKKDIIK
ncbi:MAG: glycosyltransferase, partial [Candidatus Pacebacteria bacterium]|nr:glycosyltransferase [Candidatus Paceibacterota bacterium]